MWFWLVVVIPQLTAGQSSGGSGGGGSSGGGGHGGGFGYHSGGSGGGNNCDATCGIAVGATFGGALVLCLVGWLIRWCLQPRPPAWARSPSSASALHLTSWEPLIGLPSHHWVAWYHENDWVQWSPHFIIMATGHITGQGHDQSDRPLQPFSLDGQLQSRAGTLHFTFQKQYYRDDRREVRTHCIHYEGRIVGQNEQWLWQGTWKRSSRYSSGNGRFVAYAPWRTSVPCLSSSDGLHEITLDT